MKFIKAFFFTVIAGYLIYLISVALMIDSPIYGEYWVPEMITIKRALARQYAGKRKIVVAGGSSVLFGVDAEYASKQLGVPVINYGLHAGLRLERILREAGAVVERGDLLILQLEPTYYYYNPDWDYWQITNIIAWDHDSWKEMNFWTRCKFLTSITPGLCKQMVVAEIQRRFSSPIVSARLAALDNPSVLTRFFARATPATFSYSAYNLDDHGDMLRTDGSNYSGPGWDVAKPEHLSDKSAKILVAFVNAMKKKGVRVCFTNTPYIASDGDSADLRRGELSFRSDMARVGLIIERREDMVFERKYFFNSLLHLNAEGRLLRTDMLIKSVRGILSSGTIPMAGQ